MSQNNGIDVMGTLNNGDGGIAVKHITHEEAIQRAKDVAVRVKIRFDFLEENCRQPLETIQDDIDAGLVRAMVPKRWGGHELGFDTLMKTAIEIAKADPSAGWTYSSPFVYYSNDHMHCLLNFHGQRKRLSCINWENLFPHNYS